MRDPLTWSFPIGRFFGITVRVHLLFLFFTIGMVARGLTAKENYALEALAMQAILFISVLLHEFGHCFAARQVDGDASEILMWPLGGLASVDVPNTWRANLITVVGGPLVNVILCVASTSALAVYGLVPPINPLWDPIPSEQVLRSFGGGTIELNAVALFFARLFWVNWILFWFNILLVGFPLDGGRILQCLLWRYVGFRRATLAAIFSGWIVALLLALGVVVFFKAWDDASLLMLFFLALFMYATCKQEFMLLEGRMNDESVFGYDFSQGYTSLEKEQQAPAPRRRRPNFWQRWLQRRADRRRQRDEEERVHEEARLDELLAKVRANGTQSLTEEEKRFLNRVSAKLRNRNRS
jgi:Zn-dependent protease